MTPGNVRTEAHPLSESDYRRLVGHALRRATLETGQMGRLADAAGCDDRTLRNARDEVNSLSGRALINLLAVDPAMLDGLLANFGLRAVPVDCTTPAYATMLAEAAGLVAVTADAMTDGRVDHQEEAEIIDMQRAAVRTMSANVARYDRKRA